MKQRWVQGGLLLAVLLLAFGLRFHKLEAQSFWNDEGNSARLSERAIPLIIEGTASDIHPPFYYLILRGWRELVGETELGLRSFSAFVGVGTVAVTLALGKELITKERREKGAKGRGFIGVLVAGVVTAVSPALVYYSQETRMYALLALEAVLSTWLLLRLIRKRSATPSHWQLAIDHWPLTMFYALVITAGLYTHYFFPAIILGHALYVTVQALKISQPTNQQTGKLTNLPFPWFLALLTAGLLYLPWLPIFWEQVGGRAGSDVALLAFLRQSGNWLVTGETLPTAQATLPLLAALVLAGLGVVYGRSRALLPLLMFITPLVFMAATGATQPQFFKFLGVAVPFLALLIGEIGDWRLEIKRLPNLQSLISILVILLLFVLLLWGSGRSLYNLYSNPAYARADYRSMAARITAENHPNAAIVLNAPNQWEVFTYYYHDAGRVYPLPRGTPNAAVISAELQDIAAQYDRIYAIFWGEAQRDPERLVERWLDEHAFKATDEWYKDVRFVTYAVPDAAAAEMETETAVSFGPHISLNGFTLNNTTLQPGDIIQVTLFWQTDAPLEQRYKVFLHLLNASGQLVAQRDSEPGGGLNLTTIWRSGEVVVDNHGILIPPGTPPGPYTLLLGLYDVADPTARLSLQNGEDALPLAQIEIGN